MERSIVFGITKSLLAMVYRVYNKSYNTYTAGWISAICCPILIKVGPFKPISEKNLLFSSANESDSLMLCFYNEYLYF
jgi:hypothetical protein